MKKIFLFLIVLAIMGFVIYILIINKDKDSIKIKPFPPSNKKKIITIKTIPFEDVIDEYE